MKIEYWKDDAWQWEFIVMKGKREQAVARSPKTYASAGSAVRAAQSFLGTVKHGARVQVSRRA